MRSEGANDSPASPRAFTGRFRALLRTEGHDNERSIRRKDRLEEPPNETASERKGSTSVSSRGASLRTFFRLLDVDGDCGPPKSQSREHRRLSRLLRRLRKRLRSFGNLSEKSELTPPIFS